MLERLGALKWREVRAPLATVVGVRPSAQPWRELRGIRAPGTGVPGLMALCTTRGRFGRDFCAVYAGSGAVVVDLAGAAWSRFVVSCSDPDTVVSELRGQLPAAK